MRERQVNRSPEPWSWQTSHAYIAGEAGHRQAIPGQNAHPHICLCMVLEATALQSPTEVPREAKCPVPRVGGVPSDSVGRQGRERGCINRPGAGCMLVTFVAAARA